MIMFKRLLKYAKSYKFILFLSICFSIVSVFLNSISIWLIGTILSNIMNPNIEYIKDPKSINEYLNYIIQKIIGIGSQIDQLKMLCLLLILIFIIKNILFYASNTIISYVQNRVVSNLRTELFQYINTLSLSFLKISLYSSFSGISHSVPLSSVKFNSDT